SMVGFFALLTLAPAAVGITSGQVFYVWFSVFNLFVTMLFWALMADRFSLEQSKGFCALISVGGTLGAIFGPWLAGVLVGALGTPTLLLISAGFLMVSLVLAWAIARGQHAGASPAAAAVAAEDHAIIAGSAWQGLRAVFQS